MTTEQAPLKRRECIHCGLEVRIAGSYGLIHVSTGHRTCRKRTGPITTAKVDEAAELPERIWIDRARRIYPINPDNADFDDAPVEYTRARVGTAPQVQEVWNEAIRIALATCRIKADSLRLGAEEGEAPCYAEDIELCQELGSRLAVALSSAKGAAGDRGSAPEVSGADDYIAWCRYVNHGQDEDSGADIITIEICASDAKGAFRVYYKPVAAVNAYRAGSAEWLPIADKLHIAVCQSQICLTQGENFQASQILRQALVDYADAVEPLPAPPAPPADSEGEK